MKIVSKHKSNLIIMTQCYTIYLKFNPTDLLIFFYLNAGSLNC